MDKYCGLKKISYSILLSVLTTCSIIQPALASSGLSSQVEASIQDVKDNGQLYDVDRYRSLINLLTQQNLLVSPIITSGNQYNVDTFVSNILDLGSKYSPIVSNEILELVLKFEPDMAIVKRILEELFYTRNEPRLVLDLCLAQFAYLSSVELKQISLKFIQNAFVKLNGQIEPSKTKKLFETIKKDLEEISNKAMNDKEDQRYVLMAAQTFKKVQNHTLPSSLVIKLGRKMKWDYESHDGERKYDFLTKMFVSSLVEYLDYIHYFDSMNDSELAAIITKQLSPLETMGSLLELTRRPIHSIAKEFFEKIADSNDELPQKLAADYLVFYFHEREYHHVFRSAFHRIMEPEQFKMLLADNRNISYSNFVKDGSVLVSLLLPDHAPLALKIIKKESINAWREAFNLDWSTKDHGFDYVPIEPIFGIDEILKKYDQNGQLTKVIHQFLEESSERNAYFMQGTSLHKDYEMVFSEILMGANYLLYDKFKTDFELFPIFSTYDVIKDRIAEMDNLYDRINDILGSSGIFHGHYEQNVVVAWDNNEQRFRLYVIDFDRAHFTPQLPNKNKKLGEVSPLRLMCSEIF